MNEEERKVYLEGQDKFGAKKGDTVFIFRKAKTGEAGWGTFWDTRMDETVGKKGQVIDIQSYVGIHIRIPGIQVNYWYPYFVLRLK